MKNMSRGSTKGLKQHHKDKEQGTQDALLQACRDLGNEKPHALWTKTELWKRAGLKSGMALSNPRHSNIVVLFDQHNVAVRAAIQDGSIGKGEPKTVRDTVRTLREQIAEITTQRDMAASWNAIYQQEALHYKQQADDLQVLNTRLETERDEWRSKFFKSNKPKST